MDDASLVAALDETAVAVRRALDGLDNWGLAGTTAGQYRSDLVADEAALGVLDDANLGVLSEESGLHDPDRGLVVVLDPVDGSANASRGLPWFATSLCAVDSRGPRAAVVVNQATGERFEAIRDGGARCDGRELRASSCRHLSEAVVGLAGWAPYLGWRQFRALGAAALDLCAVGAGRLDAYADFSASSHGPWDYLGGLLVCQEAGAVVCDAFDRDLVVLEPGQRRVPVAAATPSLLSEIVGLRLQHG